MCHGCVAIQVRVPVCAGVGAEPVQGEEAARSDDCGEVQYIQIRGLRKT